MRELERLLEADKQAPIPEVPDAAFTAAAVAHRLGKHPGQARRTNLPVLTAAGVLSLAVVATALLEGLPWLLVLPAAAVTLMPILIRKGV